MNKKHTPIDDLKSLPYLKVKDCPIVTGLSQGYVRELISSGLLPVARHGRCIYVNKQMLLDTVEHELRQQMKTGSTEERC